MQCSKIGLSLKVDCYLVSCVYKNLFSSDIETTEHWLILTKLFGMPLQLHGNQTVLKLKKILARSKWWKQTHWSGRQNKAVYKFWLICCGLESHDTAVHWSNMICTRFLNCRHWENSAQICHRCKKLLCSTSAVLLSTYSIQQCSDVFEIRYTVWQGKTYIWIRTT